MPLPVEIAVKLIGVPGQIAVEGAALIDTVGVTCGVTDMVKSAEAVTGVAQVSLELSTTDITSPFANDDEL
ncbi:MAG TPA: hypothetical protein VEB42_02610 [Chitinophagaceae bacterium]|nr:hypothetical protein [Chitinophagaceae bacterium]